jgi:FimV-like protein
MSKNHLMRVFILLLLPLAVFASSPSATTVAQSTNVQALQQQVQQLKGEVQQLKQQNQMMFRVLYQETENTNNVAQARALPTLSNMLFSFASTYSHCAKGNCTVLTNINLTGSNPRTFINKTNLMFAAGAAIVVILIALLFLLLSSGEKKTIEKGSVRESLAKPTDKAMQQVAGEDVLASKLDLARAMIDMDDLASAKQILEDVAVHGNEQQQAEAKALLDNLAV